MTTWNDIPFDENANAATKAREFDAQLAENSNIDLGTDPLTDYEDQTGQR